MAEDMVKKDVNTDHADKREEIKEYLEKKPDSPKDDDFVSAPKRKDKKRWFILGAVVVLLMLVVAFLSYSKGQSSFENGKVSLSIEMPADIESGSEVSFTIGYENDNSVDLKDAKLSLYFPDNFVLTSSDRALDKDGNVPFLKMDKISKNSTDKIRIFGKFVGDVGNEENIKAIMKYRPSNFNSEFQAEASNMAKITSVPVELSMRFPDGGIKNDVDTEASFTIKNTSSRNFQKAKVEIMFPKSFSFVSSDVAVAPTNEDENRFSFELDRLDPGKEASVLIKGNFHSDTDKENVLTDVYLAEENSEYVKYIARTEEVAITRPGISVIETINGAEDYVAGKNEELEYKIEFTNQSAGEIRGLTLKSILTGNYDFASIKADKGTVNKNEIIWSAAKVPALAQLKPGDMGSVSFKVKVKDIFPIQKESDKNFLLENKFTINTSDQEIINLTKTSKVRAYMALETKGYFNDDGRIANGGALPPKVGQKTYYTIHWSVRNLFNEVENVQIKSKLPKGVAWTGKYIDSKGKVITGTDTGIGTELSEDKESLSEEDVNKISEEKLYYDTNANSVIWQIPKLKANDGILTSAKEIVFQIEAVPQTENVGKAMDIIDNITATGYDTFAEQSITNSGKKVTTELFDDYSISTDQAIVQG